MTSSAWVSLPLLHWETASVLLSLGHDPRATCISFPNRGHKFGMEGATMAGVCAPSCSVTGRCAHGRAFLTDLTDSQKEGATQGHTSLLPFLLLAV
jgi:hypothetical protein